MRQRKRAAFSLVELITVIGIIAILIALLLPTLVRARQAAKSLACQSNLRQIFQAALMRSNDHGGFLQIAGSINFVTEVTPQSLDDAEEKRYLWYNDAGVKRPAPMQAALASYLGVKDVRLDDAANMVADLDKGIIRKIFSCPSQDEPLPSMMIGSEPINWYGPLIPMGYVYNEGLLGWEGTPHRLRGNLAKARPSSEFVFMTDGQPRTEGFSKFNAWFPQPLGRCTLADIYTLVPGTGIASQFDASRHPRYRMNIVFCDGHVDSLVINEKDLQRAVIVAE